MQILRTILTILFVIDCIALTVVVLMQEGKSQGLGAIAGAADTYWGKNKGRSMEGVLVKLTRILLFLFLALFSLFMVLPMIYMISNSFKPQNELLVFPPRLFPTEPTLRNFRDMFTVMSSSNVPFIRYIFNSLFVTAVGSAGHILLSSMCAFPLAKKRFPGRKIIFNIIVFSLMFNTAVTAIPNYLIMSELKWIDTYAALIVPAFGMSLGLYLMKQVMELPEEKREIVADNVFRQMCDTRTPQGILTVLKKPVWTVEDILKGDAPLVMVLEDLQDPGNAGTIFRTGEGAGVSGVFLTKTCVDITNPKVIRSTMGSVYRMPFLYVEDVVSLKAELEQKGIRTFAAHLKGKNSYDQEDYQGGTAFLIGNEGNGLTEEAAEAADCLIRIPMCGKVESLNAAMAAGILMYEAARQRR